MERVGERIGKEEFYKRLEGVAKRVVALGGYRKKWGRRPVMVRCEKGGECYKGEEFYREVNGESVVYARLKTRSWLEWEKQIRARLDFQKGMLECYLDYELPAGSRRLLQVDEFDPRSLYDQTNEETPVFE